MELNGTPSRFHLTPEGWVPSRGSGDSSAGGWRERPDRTVETWELESDEEGAVRRRWRQTWVNGRVNPGIRDGIRASFPPPVDAESPPIRP